MLSSLFLKAPREITVNVGSDLAGIVPFRVTGNFGLRERAVLNKLNPPNLSREWKMLLEKLAHSLSTEHGASTKAWREILKQAESDRPTQIHGKNEDAVDVSHAIAMVEDEIQCIIDSQTRAEDRAIAAGGLVAVLFRVIPKDQVEANIRLVMDSTETGDALINTLVQRFFPGRSLDDLSLLFQSLIQAMNLDQGEDGYKDIELLSTEPPTAVTEPPKDEPVAEQPKELELPILAGDGGPEPVVVPPILFETASA